MPLPTGINGSSLPWMTVVGTERRCIAPARCQLDTARI
jgi:hypothetical protein